MGTEAADKALILLVGLGGMVGVFLYRIGRFGRQGLPKIEGAIPLVLALAIWLPTAVGTVPFEVASLTAALSVPLIVWGWPEVRSAFTVVRGDQGGVFINLILAVVVAAWLTSRINPELIRSWFR